MPFTRRVPQTHFSVVARSKRGIAVALAQRGKPSRITARVKRSPTISAAKVGWL
jgi:hypothetical protein